MKPGVLNQAVCRSCFERYGVYWTTDDAHFWKNGYVMCPLDAGGNANVADIILNRPAYNIKAVPKHCRFALEQIVSG
jgi:hypothetical protein